MGRKGRRRWSEETGQWVPVEAPTTLEAMDWVPEMGKRLDEERKAAMQLDEPYAVHSYVEARRAGLADTSQGMARDEAIGHVFGRHATQMTAPSFEKRRFGTYVHGRPFVVPRFQKLIGGYFV